MVAVCPPFTVLDSPRMLLYQEFPMFLLSELHNKKNLCVGCYLLILTVSEIEVEISILVNFKIVV